MAEKKIGKTLRDRDGDEIPKSYAKPGDPHGDPLPTARSALIGEAFEHFAGDGGRTGNIIERRLSIELSIERLGRGKHCSPFGTQFYGNLCADLIMKKSVDELVDMRSFIALLHGIAK